MYYSDLKKFLYDEDKDLFNKIFEKDSFSFENDIMIDQTSMYDETDAESAANDAKRFGCRISGEDIWLPSNLSFNISRATDYPNSEMNIKRNGIEYTLNYIEDREYINAEFTNFGKKLETYANSKGISLYDAYGDLLQIEKIFGIAFV